MRRSSYTTQLGTTPIPLFGRASTIELARVLSMERRLTVRTSQLELQVARVALRNSYIATETRKNDRRPPVRYGSSIFLSIYQDQKLRNSARLPSCLNTTTSNSETILRNFFIFYTWQHPKRNNSARLWIWQHQKQNNSARLPSKSWQPRTNAFSDFSPRPI